MHNPVPDPVFPPPHGQASALTWHVHLRRELRHADARFRLEIAFQSPARRVVLFGPSGAGKSQTLRCMAGLSRCDSGEIWLNGEWLEHTARGLWLPPRQRRLGHVPQDYALFPHLTVRQNVAFGLHRGVFNPPARAQRDAATATVDAWLAQTGLMAVSSLRPHQLSGGQRQRTAVARALVAQPRALLLDEPFAALDRPLQRQLRADLLDLQASLDIPMMLITHDEDDLHAVGGEVIDINAGRAIATRQPITEST